MDRAIKALSLLLSYPTHALQRAMPEIGAVLDSDMRLTAATRQQLRLLARSLSACDIYDLEETYVELFDRSRTLSLNLFEHVHGESRDRGAAMVSLLEMYRDAGFEPATQELPDHLPILLEYLAMRPFEETQDILADAGHILVAIKTRLMRRQSPYSVVFGALLQFTGVEADRKAVAELLDQPDDNPNDLDALDAVWEETAVHFGPDPNAGCPQVRSMLAHMDVPIHATPHPAAE